MFKYPCQEVLRIKESEKAQPAISQVNPSWVVTLLEIIDSMKHGSVTIIVQDGIVIQIDKNEKFRLKNQVNRKGTA